MLEKLRQEAAKAPESLDEPEVLGPDGKPAETPPEANQEVLRPERSAAYVDGKLIPDKEPVEVEVVRGDAVPDPSLYPEDRVERATLVTSHPGYTARARLVEDEP